MSRQIDIFDTTTRDGEQGSSITLTPREKLEIALKSEELGVQIIEVGFGASSKGDQESIILVSREVRACSICALSRAVISDVDDCARVLEGAAQPRIHTGIGVSQNHIMGKFGDDKYGRTFEEKQDTIFQMGVDAVRHARKFVNDVEFYAEDSGRAVREFLYRMLEGVIDAGATVVNIPDTTGYTFPGEFGRLIRDIRKNVSNIDKAVISVHGHNDLGMAGGTTIEGILAGAAQFEGTWNGYGERAGSVAIEEIIMAIHTRGKEFGIHTDANIKHIKSISRLVSRIFGIPVPRSKPIVGAEVWNHSSGIHADGILKAKDTYEIMTPQDIGADDGKIVVTARSGRHALKHCLAELGYDFTEKQLEMAYGLCMTLADAKDITNSDLEDIAEMVINAPPQDVFSIFDVSITGKYQAVIHALLNNKAVCWSGFASDGPIDAAVQAIRTGTETDFEIDDYEARSVGSGSNAPAVVSVRIRHNGKVAHGKWLDTDTIKASIIAYTHAVFSATNIED